MEVNLEKLISLSLSLEGFLVLYCLYNEEEANLLKYIVKVNKIPSLIFNKLVSDGWLIYSGDMVKPDYNLNNIELTDRFSKEIMEIQPNKVSLSFDECFQQLREHYPIKAGNSERRLHGDLTRCKNLYKTTIVKNGKINEELHSVILQCINFEVNLKTKSRSLDYFQLLATWLSQRTWELYIKDVEELIRKNGFVDKNGENRGNIDAI